jgi:hypothetical protein
MQDNADRRITFRLTSPQAEALRRIGAQRVAEGTLPRSARGGRQPILAALIREALEAHFGLPCTDEKTDAATNLVTA